MKPFVLLTTRDHDQAADDEYTSYVAMSGLAPDQLNWIRLEAGPLPNIDLTEISGIILGGSPFNASDPDATKSLVQQRVETDLGNLLELIVARDFPFLGICYGVGTLGRLIGCTVDRQFGEITNEVPITLTEAGRADPLCVGLPATFGAFVGHKEAVSVLSDSATLLAIGTSCAVQMFRYRKNSYATQFHPELDGPAFASRIDLYRDGGYYPPDRADELISTALASSANCGRIIANFVTRYAR